MTQPVPAYGLWSLVAINSVIFIIFALSFFKPRSGRDWRSFGAFSGFLVALFTEMYGFPLTIYLLYGWLTRRFPGVDFFSHNAGHLFETLVSKGVNPHFGPFHILSNLFIFAGFFLLHISWMVLYKAQRTQSLATTGPYSRMRHPQYTAFTLIMIGFFLQWPTAVTLIMLPVLVTMYVRLARREEREMSKTHGEEYERYASETPAFFPRIRRPFSRNTASGSELPGLRLRGAPSKERNTLE